MIAVRREGLNSALSALMDVEETADASQASMQCEPSDGLNLADSLAAARTQLSMAYERYLFVTEHLPGNVAVVYSSNHPQTAQPSTNRPGKVVSLPIPGKFSSTKMLGVTCNSGPLIGLLRLQHLCNLWRETARGWFARRRSRILQNASKPYSPKTSRGGKDKIGPLSLPEHQNQSSSVPRQQQMESEAKQASMKGQERVQQDKTPQDSRLHANVDTLPLQSQQASVSNNSIRDVVANESSEPLVPEQQLTKLTENTAPPQPQDSLQVLFSPLTKESSSSSMTVNTASVTSSPGRVTAAALTGGRCTSNATAKRRRWNQAEEAALIAAVQSVFAATVVAAGAGALADAPSIGDREMGASANRLHLHKAKHHPEWNAKEIRDRWKKLQGRISIK